MATASDQRALELVVSERLRNSAVAGDLSGFVLEESRYFFATHYVAPWEQQWAPITDSASRQAAVRRSDESATFYRDAQHTRELSTRLRTITPDAAGSCSTRDPCRFGSGPGLVAFSVAFVRGDSAQLIAYVLHKREPRANSAGRFYVGIMSRYHFLLQRTGSDWQIVRMHVIES
jgi:hypothetical protein